MIAALIAGYCMDDPRDRETSGAGCLLSIAGGFVLTILLAGIGNAFEWPYVNGWSVGHGTFIVVWPALTWLCLLVIRRFR